MTKLKVLFVCEENRFRSKTAEAIYAGCPNVEVKSAGMSPTAITRISLDLLEWADKVFVMEKRQRNRVHKLFPEVYARKSITCLYVPDEYEYMEPALVGILTDKLTPYIGSPKSLESKDPSEPDDAK